MVARTATGRALRKLLPADADPWVPEHFFAEVGSVVRRWVHTETLTEAQGSAALARLVAWPLHRTQLRSTVTDAWRHRHNITFADALYVVLAELHATILTGDHKLANGPTLPSPSPTSRHRRRPATTPANAGVRTSGAREENRTPDLLITSEPLCRLSYPGGGYLCVRRMSGEGRAGGAAP